MTVDRECDSAKRDMQGIREVCQLVGRCIGHLGNVKSHG